MVPAKDMISNHCHDNHSFLNKKQKIIHHDKLQPECRKEKHYLIKLLSQFQEKYKSLVSLIDNMSVKKTKERCLNLRQYEAQFSKKEE